MSCRGGPRRVGHWSGEVNQSMGVLAQGDESAGSRQTRGARGYLVYIVFTVVVALAWVSLRR